ncbi:precorrin-2 C(20)-methyltransferase [Candidatus Electronema sp. PJ]|uniref:precorrin-2 C(20)-methyltransferase n=1 Tax=Candidatus Electronema sp. PJ TaxID=3401572 RepID=UPI003AA851B1
MRMTAAQMGRLYIVGIGPGDPELMTCKAVRILEQARVWAVPKAKEEGMSSALQIARAMVATDGKTVLELCFPMKKIRLGQQPAPDVAQGWQEAAQAVLAHLEQGQDVAFPTLGDPAIYSTAFYLLHTLRELQPSLPVTVVPGITAMSACAAQVISPLGLGDDVVTVVPAAFDDERLRDILLTADAVVLMKMFRQLPRLISLLDELGLTDKAVLVERCGLDDQHIYTDIRLALGRELHYFSTLIVRKKQISH